MTAPASQDAPLRVAYLIMTHAAPEMLRAQLELLGAPAEGFCADFYVHVDAKADIAPFRAAAEDWRKSRQGSDGQARFLDERVAVNWMGFSVVEAGLRLLRAATAARRDYKYYKLLSGACAPLKPPAEMRRFFDEHDCEFIQMFGPADEDLEWRRKLDLRYPIDAIPIVHFLKPEYFRARPARSLLRWPREIVFWGLFYLFRIHAPWRGLLPKRKPPLPNLRPYAGEWWWCLGDACARYLLDFCDRHPEVVRFFQDAHCPDELFVPTVVMNSPHAARVSDAPVHVNMALEEEVTPMAIRGLFLRWGGVFGRKLEPRHLPYFRAAMRAAARAPDARARLPEKRAALDGL